MSANTVLSKKVTELEARVAALEARLDAAAAAAPAPVVAKGGKRVKKEKAPDAPKRAPSAYIVFGNQKRAELKTSNPTAKFAEIAKLISEAWKLLSDDQKAAYKTVAE
jgi:hypothetical protein